MMRHFNTVLCAVSLLQGLVYAQNATLSVSLDGSCGAAVNQTCMKSTYGDCCSGRGYCGGTSDYCSPTNGCQSGFGSCAQSSVISVDGRCGSQDPLHQVCIGSVFGSCCSTNGWCGNTTTYCGQGCQSSAGTCGGAGITINTGTNGTSSSSPSSTSTVSSSTYTSSTASSSSSSGSSSESSELANTKSSLTAMKAGLGVVAALLAIALIAIVWLMFFRKPTKKLPEQEHIEKPHTDVEDAPSYTSHTPVNTANLVSPMSEAPHPSYSSMNDTNRWQLDSKTQAHELGTNVGVAELRGTEGGMDGVIDKKH